MSRFITQMMKGIIIIKENILQKVGKEIDGILQEGRICKSARTEEIFVGADLYICPLRRAKPAVICGNGRIYEFALTGRRGHILYLSLYW